jgi:rhodanese-related sulfurtransferase
MSRTIPSQELKAMLGNSNLTLIDVRRKDDYAADQSAIPGATWLDPAEINNWCNTLPNDQEVILYCVRGGAVSNSVVEALQTQGLKARFIEGGITAWKEAGGSLIAK